MERFKNILVVSGDGDGQARRLLRPAVELAAPASGVITLLNLATPRSGWAAIGAAQSSSAVLSSPVHRLYDPGPELRDAGVPVHHETTNGVPHLEILERIAVYGHDLVIMGAESHLGSTLSGRSTVTRVVRGSQVPVWVHPETPKTGGPIAVAVGPRDEQDPNDDLSKRLIAAGASLARSLGRDLHVIHAWRLDGETMMRGRRLAHDVADIGRMAREVQFEARMRVEALLADVNVADINTTVHVERGHSGDVITSLVGSLEPHVLVMGTLGRQGIQGVVIGNTVERVARRIESPVMALKPGGLLLTESAIEDWTPHALPY